MALAGSFFSVDPSGARWRIFPYLVFTMAPFAVVGPLIGPMMDWARGGRRIMLFVSALRAGGDGDPDGVGGRREPAGVSRGLPDVDFAKSYQVAKAASCRRCRRLDSALVEANSKLLRLLGLGGLQVGLPGLLPLLIGAPR